MKEGWFRFFYALIWPFFNLLHPGKVMGREKVPQGGALLCGNHTRLSDPFFIIFAMKRKDHPYVMGKAELMRFKPLGWLLNKVGMIPVDRGKSDVKAIKESMRVLKDGRKLIMFPEGTRHKDGESRDAKTGAAMLALRTGVPIVPIYIPAKKKWFRRTLVVFGEPYYPQASEDGRRATPEEYRAIADDLLERIRVLGEGVK